MSGLKLSSSVNIIWMTAPPLNHVKLDNVRTCVGPFRHAEFEEDERSEAGAQVRSRGKAEGETETR